MVDADRKNLWLIIVHIICCGLLLLLLTGSFGVVLGFVTNKITIIIIAVLIIAFVFYWRRKYA